MSTQSPITLTTLRDGLRALGVQPEQCVLVHCAMSKIGQIHGGAQSLIEALIDIVGPDGTIVMPTLTLGRFDPSEWGNPPAPEHTWDQIRYDTPLFDPLKTPVDHTMSRMYELFRTWPGVTRSNHPHTSMAAWGRHRDAIIAEHRLEDRCGETSPLARLYDLDAHIVFIGTSHNTNTSMHLAEYRQTNVPTREFMIVQERNGTKQLITYTDVDTDSSRFEGIGQDYEIAHPPLSTRIGDATCKLMPMRLVVDFTRDWLSTNPR